MQENPFDDFNPVGPVPLDECCVCLGLPITSIIAIERERFPFDAACVHRSTFLRRGQSAGWPGLRIEGITGIYALSGDAQAYVLSALQGTDDRIVELLDALDEYEQNAA